MKYFLIFIMNLAFVYANNFYYEFGKKVELQENKESRSLNKQNNINQIREYTTKDGKKVMFKENEILVQCNKDSYCEDDFLDLELTNVKKISDSFYLIKLNKNQDIFEKSQKLFKKENIKSAHPNYIISREAR